MATTMYLFLKYFSNNFINCLLISSFPYNNMKYLDKANLLQLESINLWYS